MTTRQAIQAAAACAVALAIGQVLSEDRWYWAVGTTWWIFVNTVSRGETLVRGFRRVLGTVIGIAVGMVVAIPLDGAVVPTAALVALCVFGIFYTAPVSYSWMMLAVTVMAGLLYGLLGVLDPALLVLRLEETAVGAASAALAVLLILPVTTHAINDAWIQRALRGVRSATSASLRRLSGDEDADPTPHAAELELLLGRVRLSLAPLVHPLSPFRGRKARARRVLALLDECADEVRGLAAVAADPAASHDARLAAACWRVEAAVERLTSPQGGREAGERVAADGALAPAAWSWRSVTSAVWRSSSPRSTSRCGRRRAPCSSAPDRPVLPARAASSAHPSLWSRPPATVGRTQAGRPRPAAGTGEAPWAAQGRFGTGAPYVRTSAPSPRRAGAVSSPPMWTRRREG